VNRAEESLKEESLYLNNDMTTAALRTTMPLLRETPYSYEAPSGVSPRCTVSYYCKKARRERYYVLARSEAKPELPRT
jgi:hypothetical protein